MKKNPKKEIAKQYCSHSQLLTPNSKLFSSPTLNSQPSSSAKQPTSRFNLTTLFFGTTVFFMTLLGVFMFIVFSGYSLEKRGEKGVVGDGDGFSLASKVSEVEAYDSALGVRCFDNYQSWKSSTNFKTDTPWSTIFMATDPINPTFGSYNSNDRSYGKYHYFDFKTDVNGDGLPDYVYAYYHDSFSKDCVYLSNGQGWVPAYRCVYANGKFHGDCAG